MKQVLIKEGKAILAEVPAPMAEPGRVLVAVDHSCVSIGTELSGLKSSGTPLWKRVVRPGNMAKVFELVKNQGLAATKNLVQSRLSAEGPTGYSVAGTVLAVGAGIEDLRPGDRVACAGAQCAYHAEIVAVPRNLTVAIPEGLDFASASTVTLGAIALQGVRRANPTLGETFVVIGLGIIGQLTAQLLKANGCRVIGSDLDEARVKLAEGLGLDVGLLPGADALEQSVARLTDGIGADGVIITAATPSDAVISTAFKMCRKKGRVVVIGEVGLNLHRADIYEKELDFFISTSYGPGRYDRGYEENGLDYPVSYVRWTENRNMAEYLRLLSESRVKVAPLIAETAPIEEAPAAYDKLKSGRVFPPMILLRYPGQSLSTAAASRRVANPMAKPAVTGRIRVALVGAGAFAKETLLPNLRALGESFQLQAIVSRHAENAAIVSKQFGAAYATADYDAVLADPDVDAVILCTRHDLHASMALRALQAGKHVLVEKPLALSEEELAPLETHLTSGLGGARSILLTGFNRRFSPFASRLKELTKHRKSPLLINYRMNAGYLPKDHWTHSAEGGGRNKGEACHIYDLFTFLTDSLCTDIQAMTITPATAYYSHRDNFVATMAFADGSLATLTYTALGSPAHPKEQMEVFVEGKVLVLDNYKQLHIRGGSEAGIDLRLIEKGYQEELAAFAQGVRSGQWPSPLWQQLQATRIALRVDALLGKGAPCAAS